MKVNIKYKSIIKYEDYRDTIEYNSQGHYDEHGDDFELVFTTDGNRIKIEKAGDSIYLYNNDSKLVLCDEELLNDYSTPYGTFEFVTKLDKFEYLKPNLKIKYTLSQNDERVNEIFVVVKIMEKDDGDENI